MRAGEPTTTTSLFRSWEGYREDVASVRRFDPAVREGGSQVVDGGRAGAVHEVQFPDSAASQVVRSALQPVPARPQQVEPADD